MLTWVLSGQWLLSNQWVLNDQWVLPPGACAVLMRPPGLKCYTPHVPLRPLLTCSPSAQAREHFHVPLTWNPFGYSTYRGS